MTFTNISCKKADKDRERKYIKKHKYEGERTIKLYIIRCRRDAKTVEKAP